MNIIGKNGGDLNFNVKNNFQQIFTTCWAQIGRKTRNAQNLLKLRTFDISNLPILILMSKITFMKYLPPARPKLVPKLKMVRIY